MTGGWEGFGLRLVGGVPCVVAESLDAAGGVRHWFSTRQGGVSGDAFASLNLGMATGDERGRVEANRDRLWRSLALPAPPVIPRQVHGSGVLVLDAASLDAARAQPPEADSVMTALPGVPIAVLTADCPSVVIFDRATPAIAVVHAGWRGMARSAVWKALVSMIETFGTRPEECVAALGPSVGPACYEVGEDVRAVFVRGLPYGQDVLRRAPDQGKWFADLVETGRRQLLDARLAPSRVTACPACTHCEREWFYSVRRDGARTGRQVTIAMLPA